MTAGAFPKQVNSTEDLSGGLRVIHQSLRLTKSDLTSQRAISQNVMSLASDGFRDGSIISGETTPLDQFIRTVSEQAVRENWKSLHVDVWIGGKVSPIGYYFRYEALDSTGSSIRGEAFLAASADLARAYLDAYLRLSSP